jgi:hypothetical protein
MAKKSRAAGQPNPAIRLSNLGPRLARLLADADDASALPAELDRLTDGLKPGSFLPIVVGAFATAPEEQRGRLNTGVSAWLRERGLLESLHELEARQTFRAPAEAIARAWLEEGGITVAPVRAPDPAELFLAAYELGEVSQDSPTLFWHEDARRRRIRSAAFLIDFEPPWEGALKDVAYATHRDLDQATEEFFGLWRMQGLHPHRLDAATAGQRVWAALRQNQAQGIRLPADLIAVLPQILPFLLALPGGPDAAPLSAAEVEALATNGRTPESIRHEERLFGFQTRMPDGSIARVQPPPDDELWDDK